MFIPRVVQVWAGEHVEGGAVGVRDGLGVASYVHK